MHIIKLIKVQIEQVFSSKEKRLAVLIVLLIELISITPLCGFLFQCGCDWPWLGLDEKCNIHQANIKNQCPWCVSMLMGVFSTAVAIISGVVVSSAALGRVSNQSRGKQLLIRIMLGLGVFILVAGLMAVLAILLR